MGSLTKRSSMRDRSKEKREKAAASAQVGFDLHISGLCAFVPYKDLATQVARMKVVLVDALSPAYLYNNKDSAVHVPALLVPDSCLYHPGPGTRAAAFSFEGSYSHYPAGPVWAYPLFQESVTIMGLGNNDIKPVTDGTPGPSDTCPSGAPPAFGWIRDMPSGAGVMTQDAFSQSYTNVIGRMDLYDGALFTSIFPYSQLYKPKLLRWYWADDQGNNGSGSQTTRAIAEEIIFAKQWPSTTTTVTMTIGSSTVVLQPYNNQIDAWLVNMPLIDILVDRGSWSGKERSKDHHFLHFHRLAKTPGTLIPWPDLDPTHICDPPGTGDVANPRCPPALFTSVG